MTSEGLGETFEGDSEDTCAGKFPLVSMGGRAEGLACADPGARTPMGAFGIFVVLEIFNSSGEIVVVSFGTSLGLLANILLLFGVLCDRR